ncbi:hypothetical protein [Halosimplex amylolyticum]|uniref:hypothetical protein n=1 Tax=Halosimplex amylolyticum TaxID=3396616 RepID=UPI003F56BFAD
MKRRALLSICVATVIGGCLGIGQQQPKLAWIWLQNHQTERYEIDVAVLDDGETVFSDAYQLNPANEEMTDLRLTAPVEGSGQYVVRATIRGETFEVDVTDVDDGAAECVGAQFAIRNDGTIESEAAVLQQC